MTPEKAPPHAERLFLPGLSALYKRPCRSHNKKTAAREAPDGARG